jgi:methylated-DNA-[protein]-cysteine S-methyltransferase
MPEQASYVLVPSKFGPFGLVWREDGKGPRVLRVVLPRGGTRTTDLLCVSFPGIGPRTAPTIDALADSLERFLAGEAVELPIGVVALSGCGEFQQRVLVAEYQVPRGWVTTYGCLARHLGVPGAARAVGGALARNPFPIIIPCHRAIGAQGTLGGFQGGLAMKRLLLEMEGVRFGKDGRVSSPRLCYDP